MEHPQMSYDPLTMILPAISLIFTYLSHITMQGVAGICAIIASLFAAVYNAIKIWEWYEKRRRVQSYEEKKQKKSQQTP